MASRQAQPDLDQKQLSENQATPLFQAEANAPKAPPNAHEDLGYNFSQISVHYTPPAIIQAKLAVSSPGDNIYEQEADRASEQVMSPSKPHGHELPQTKHDQPGYSGQMPAPPIVDEVLRTPGQPLDAATRTFMKPRFGHDFSRVRVHTDAVAGRSAKDVNASAYAVGQDIVFGAGQYAPTTPAGRWLLAHELAHAEQQHATAGRPISLGRPGDVAEQEAELAANRVMAGQQAAVRSGTANAARVVRRSNGSRTPPAPTPPGFLGPLGARATHLQGDVWDVPITSLGPSPVGPYDQLAAYLNQNRHRMSEPMEAAHIIGGEHIRDLGWNMPYNRAPCIGVAKSLHDKWTREIANLQSQRGPMGGRTTGTVGRPVVGPQDVIHLHHEVYRGIPELQDISQRIVTIESTRISGARMRATYRMPKRDSPMDAHKRPDVGKTGSPMDAHKRPDVGKTGSPMDAHKRPDVGKTGSPMDAHKRPDVGKTGSPMDAHQGTKMPQVERPLARGQVKGRAAEFGAQVLLSMQFANLQSDELAKALARFQELSPEIERLLEEGHSVIVTVEAEVPRTVNIAAEITDTRDQSQMVYFRRMYIKTAIKVPRTPAAGTRYQTYNPVGEVREGFGDPHQWDDPHELTLDQQIRLQMGDQDPAKKHQPKRSTHRVITRDQTFTPPMLTSPPIVQTRPPAPLPKPKPQLDEATKRKLAQAPSRVYILSENIIQSKTAAAVMKKLTGNASFVMEKDYMAGGGRSRTVVLYRSDLDKSRAEALAEIIRNEGVPSARTELRTDVDDVPGILEIFFGSDAEKK